MIEGLSDINFDLIFCSQQKFDRLYGELIDDFEETDDFRCENFEKQWRKIEDGLEAHLHKYWINDSFGMGDYSLIAEHNFTYHKSGAVYSKRIICSEFIQVIMKVTEEVKRSSSWVYHFTCEGESFSGEFFIKGHKVYCAGEKALLQDFRKKKLKAESLHRSVELDDINWVKQMYKPGLFYRPAVRDSKGNFPQHYIKSADVADFLIERGFDVNERNSDGHTVLDMVVNKEPWRYNRSDFSNPLCRHLISKGAKTSFEIDHPLHFQCLLGTVKAVQEELKFCNLYEFDSYLNEPPIMFALRSGVYSKVKLLLDCGADIDQKAADGDGVLATAFNCNADPKLFKLLIDNGADINASSSVQNNVSVLHLFCQRSLELVKMLVEKGADINSRDADGRTAAFHVEGQDALEILDYLSGQGLSMAEKDCSGNTCIDYFTQWAESFLHDRGISSKYMKFALKASTLLDQKSEPI